MLLFLQQRANATNILLCFIIAIGTFTTFTKLLIPAMQAASNGYGPFDMMVPLSLDKISEALPNYTVESIYHYKWFIVVDSIFPVSAGLTMTFIILWSAQYQKNRFTEFLINKNLIFIPLLGSLSDLIENFSFLAVVTSYPIEKPIITYIGFYAHQLKMILVPAGILLVLISLIVIGFVSIKKILVKD